MDNINVEDFMEQTGPCTIMVKLKKHQIFMVAMGMNSKDAKAMMNILFLARNTNRYKIFKKQFSRTNRIMKKYGYELTE